MEQKKQQYKEYAIPYIKTQGMAMAPVVRTQKELRSFSPYNNTRIYPYRLRMVHLDLISNSTMGK